MAKRGQRQSWRVTYMYRGKLTCNAAGSESAARMHAETAAHARRDRDGEDRIVRVLHVADDGAETVVATYQGGQFNDEDDE